MSNLAAFPCDRCGAQVTAQAGKGRTREYRAGLSLPIPDDYEMLTCSRCGETYVSLDEAKRLDSLQHADYLAWQVRHVSKLLDVIQKADTSLTLRKIERAAAVTPTYLSHVKAGRKEAGTTLLRLLESFALHPEDVQRHLSSGSWEQAYDAALKIPPKTSVVRGNASDVQYFSQGTTGKLSAEKRLYVPLEPLPATPETEVTAAA